MGDNYCLCSAVNQGTYDVDPRSTSDPNVSTIHSDDTKTSMIDASRTQLLHIASLKLTFRTQTLTQRMRRNRSTATHVGSFR